MIFKQRDVTGESDTELRSVSFNRTVRIKLLYQLLYKVAQ